MTELALQQTELIGRDEELNKLKSCLDNAINGEGSTIFISGEAGIGKTRLVDAFREFAATQNVTVLTGAGSADISQPFLIFSKAFGEVMEKPLFEEQEYKGFAKLFAVNMAGMLVAETSAEEEDLDADIFAGMLSAVQDFVRDSFDQAGTQKASLGRLEYGNMKILIEHGAQIFLTAVFAGEEHPDMKRLLRRTLEDIEEKHAPVLESWSGQMKDTAPIQQEIAKLADVQFLVRRNLEGISIETERLRIADEILEVLKRLSAEKPMIIFLEDLHWTDESSLFVINYLARNIRNYSILLAGTLRPRESASLQKAIDNMNNEEILDEMALEQLDFKNTIRVIDKTFPHNDFPVTLAERLYEQSKGNPLFVIEMLKGMHDDGSIAKQDGAYTLVSESYQIPATVEEVVNRRLETLDPDTMAMVEYASCIGQRFDMSLAASNRLMKEPYASLEKLLASGILLKKNGTIEFSHAVFQSVIYNGIGERWKNGHHRNLGEYLEMTYVDRLDEVIYDLARHFSRTKEYKKCTDYCTKAGEKAEGSYAMEQALEFYREALDALSRLDQTYAHDITLDILERIGDIQAIMGDFDGATGEFRKAVDIADDKETKARLLRKVGSMHERKGEYDKSLEILAEAKGLVDADKAEYGRILRIEGGIYWRKGEYDKAMPLFLKSIEIAEKIGADKKDIGNALRTVGIIHHSREEYTLAMQYYQKSLAIMEDIGELNGIAAVLNNIGVVHYEKGELDRALEFHGRSLEIKEKIGNKQGIATSLNNIGIVHADMGNQDRAVEHYEKCLAISLEIGDKSGAIYVYYGLAKVKLGKGDARAAFENGEKARRIAVKIGAKMEEGMSRRILGMAHREMKDWDRATEEFGKAQKILQEVGEKNELVILSYELALLFKAKGEPAKAKPHIEKALAMFEEMGMKLWIEKCEKALAEL